MSVRRLLAGGLVGLAALVAGVGVAACGSSPSPIGGPAPTTTVAASPTTTVAASTTTTVAASTTTTAGARRGLTAAQVKKELLTVSDLPAGWTSHPVSGGSGSAECGIGDALKRGETGKAQAEFSHGTLPAFDEVIAAYAHPPDAGFDSVVKALDRCGGFDDDGIRLTLRRIPFPTVGSRSAAYQATGTRQETTLGLDLVIAIKGDQAVALVYGDIGTPDTSQVAGLAEKAAAKMPPP